MQRVWSHVLIQGGVDRLLASARRSGEPDPSSRDVRNNPSEFREAVEREDVVLTANGKPFAIALGIQGEDVEEALELVRRLRALMAMSRMQKRAQEGGLGGASAEGVDEEIRAAREARGRSG